MTWTFSRSCFRFWSKNWTRYWTRSLCLWWCLWWWRLSDDRRFGFFLSFDESGVGVVHGLVASPVARSASGIRRNSSRVARSSSTTGFPGFCCSDETLNLLAVESLEHSSMRWAGVTDFELATIRLESVSMSSVESVWSFSSDMRDLQRAITLVTMMICTKLNVTKLWGHS